ncbi:MAG: filamentous hemagglutinin N-terminal domain-containing protein [Alphaproteobacteria bacterium]|nr:filamentous hemagglutinin N-terminal domain-containing protein [Alphaproteobacteria bacterium]MBL7096523.1 filamentous hemagglutinin N-terminal domain-containing protein [Alphaproteobacteria bacterium]
MNKTSHAIVRTLLLGTSCLSAAGFLAGVAVAQPTGGQVVLGTATITDKGPNSTVIDQKTGKAIINWNSFSIGAGGSVRFNQPNANAIALNRVLGGESSSIYGNLLANGQVWIINQNGILFGQGSTINVGGLIATTADISDTNFAAGNYSFSGGTGASVINQGTIRTRNGGVVLSGASVQNQGLIQADTGTVVLGGASAFTVDFTGDGLLKYAITQPAGTADNGQTGVSNSGTIKAAGGRVIMTARAAADVQDAVVNNTGMISATSAKVQNGEVILDAGDGDVADSGTIDASGAGRGQTGGSVSITGRNVTVADGANINVSGDSGGGTVRIGGDVHGQGPLQNAANTHVGRAAINADATRTGDGGTLVVWSNGITDFSALFSAKGGALSGNGGFLETSGRHLAISPDAKADTTAARGQTGSWLLDPKIIIVRTGEGANTTLDGNGNLALATDPTGTDVIAPSTIIGALATTNVRLEASSSIEVDSDVVYASAHSLGLFSQGGLSLFANIQNTQASGGGDINLVAGWDGVTHSGFGKGTYGLNNGTITVGGGSARSNVAVGTASGALNVYGANLLVYAVNGNAQLGYHGAGGGNISATMTGSVTVEANGASNTVANAQIGNGSLVNDVTGSVTGNISVTTDSFQSYDGASGVGWLGNVAATGSSETGDVQLLTRTGFFYASYVESDLQGGNVFVGFTDPTITPLYIGGLHYNAPHDFTFAGGGSMNVRGGIQNGGSGAVTLVAGWDGHTVGTAAQIQAANAFGLNGATINLGAGGQFENADVGSAHGLTTILTGNLILAPQAGYRAQVGYHGTGGGDIRVVATGALTLTGGAAASGYAMIGNGSLTGDVTGTVTGNISINVGGLTDLEPGTGTNNAWISNLSTATNNTGNTVLVTGKFNDAAGVAPMLVSALSNGDVTIGLTDASNPGEINKDILYNSAHTLNLLFTGNAAIEANIQNAGSGAINLLAGWDGHTLDAAHFLDSGVYGNNGATAAVFAPGANSTASLGSAGGATTVAAATVDVVAEFGFTQAILGYKGNGGGAINVVAMGDIEVVAEGSNNSTAQIGNSAGGGAATGNITINSASLTVGGQGTNATGVIGNMSTAGGSESGDITINTHGGTLTVGGGYTGHGQIGNWTNGDTTGTSSGNLTITAGAVALDGAAGYSQIGNGAFRYGNDSGAVSGNITINATTFSATTFGSASAQARVGNLGTGPVSGDILIATTGAFSAFGNLGLVSIGDAYAGIDAISGNPLQGLTTGNLTVTSGGTITLTAVNGGTSRIETGGAASGNVSVTATGDIILTSGTTGGPGSNSAVLIGTLTAGNSSTNTSVTSTNGGVRVLSLESGSSALIGNEMNGSLAGTMSGTVSVTAGNVLLNTQGDATSVARVGNMGDNGATLSGNVSVTASNVINLNGASTAIGEVDLASGPAAAISGNVTLTANNILSTSTVPVRAATLNIVQTGTGGGVGSPTARLLFNAGTLNLAGAGASFFLGSPAGTTLGAVALGMGALNLSAGGAITQSGAIAATGLVVSTTSGAIALTNTANAVGGMVAFNSPAAVSFYDTLGINAGAISAGGDLTLLSTGNINFLKDVQSNAGAITAVAGWDGTTTNAANFGNSGVYGNGSAAIAIGGTGATGSVAVGSKSGTTTLFGKILTVAAANGNAQLGYHGTGGGAIVVRTLSDVNINAVGINAAMIGNGSFTTDVTGSITGDIDLRAGGTLSFTGVTANEQFGNLAHSGTETGNLTVIVSDVNSTSNQFEGYLLNAIVGGDILLGFTGMKDEGPGTSFTYSSSHNITVLAAGNLVAPASIQNAGTGAITLVAGWDGKTLANFGNSGVAGNNGKGVTIGGTIATGNVAVGSAGGQTSVYGASLTIAAVNGYAQLGFNGNGAGAILVNVAGALTMTGGSGAGQFAQLGNGGLKTSGNNSGNITITASGAVTLTSGAGTEAYVQIGNGGAESNSGAANGYSNQGTITLGGQDVILSAGAGQAAYVQIGQGGYKVGAGITGGTATNSGAITIISAHTVALNGNASAGAGTDAYLQIGNGGGQSNLNPSAAAGGTDGGDITVTAPNGPAGSVTLTAGLGANSYAMIGNGGYAANSGATSTVANWTIGGNLSVTDLVLVGGQGTGNEFGVIGNGDASKNSVANVSGNIVISANGQITYTQGKATTSPATIGNFTGSGTVSGTLDGATPPSQVNTNPVVIGVTTTTTANTNPNQSNNSNVTTINTTVVPATGDTTGGATNVPPPSASTTPGALETMSNGGDSSEPNTSDSATTVLADSLDGARKAGSTTLLNGMLKQTSPTSASSTVHGVPPVDQDFSSWGNEALWQ